jgi:hypothetical protein
VKALSAGNFPAGDPDAEPPADAASSRDEFTASLSRAVTPLGLMTKIREVLGRTEA